MESVRDPGLKKLVAQVHSGGKWGSLGLSPVYGTVIFQPMAMWSWNPEGKGRTTKKRVLEFID